MNCKPLASNPAWMALSKILDLLSILYVAEIGDPSSASGSEP